MGDSDQATFYFRTGRKGTGSNEEEEEVKEEEEEHLPEVETEGVSLLVPLLFCKKG